MSVEFYSTDGLDMTNQISQTQQWSFKLLDLYLGDVLKWQDTWWWHWGKLCMVVVEVSQDIALHVIRVVTWKMILKWLFIGDIHYSDFLGRRVLWVNRISLGKSSMALEYDCTFIFQVSWEKELFHSEWKFYLEYGLEIDIYQWHRGRHCIFIGLVFLGHRSLQINRFTQNIILKFAADTEEDSAHPLFRSPERQNSSSWWIFNEKTLHIHCSGLLGDRALWIDKVYSDGLEISIYQSHRGSLSKFIIQVSWGTEFFRSVELYSKNGLEMAFHWWCLLFRSPEGHWALELGELYCNIMKKMS